MLMLLFLYVVLPLVQVGFYLHGRPVTGFAESLNYASSILTFHWLSANVILSAKIPRLQRIIPYDARIRFHIFSSAGIVVLFLYHATFKIILGKRIDFISWSLLALLLAMLALALLWIPVPGFIAVRNRILALARKSTVLTYDRSKSLHGYFVLALSLLIFLHVANAGLFDDVPAVSALLYLILYLFSFGVYAISKTGLFAIGATVAGVIEHKGIITISLTPDRRHRFRSGQFAFLRAQGHSSRREEHPFSYLSLPGEDQVKFAVRACGDFTNNLALLKAGDRVRINGGFGDFRPGKEEALCFIASGIGTVPFISILKELYVMGDKRPLRFFLAVTHEEEIPDLEQLREIDAQMPNLDLRLLVFSMDGLRYSKEFFYSELPDLSLYTYYICSSPRVRLDVVRSLNSLGVKNSLIRYEAFSLG